MTITNSFQSPDIMARKSSSRAKKILLAASFARTSDIPALHSLISQYPKAFNKKLLLRILLSYLPESLESVHYSWLIESLSPNQTTSNSKTCIKAIALDELCEEEPERLVCKLHLLPLAWHLPTPYFTVTDSIVSFLRHRCLRIDQSVGLITEIPTLLDPFIQSYPCLKNWMISTILPLIRFSYEYYPNEAKHITIQEFERLNEKTTVSFLLSRTGKDNSIDSDSSVGRDLRGLIGPWLHRDNRKIQRTVSKSCCSSRSSLKASLVDIKLAPWEETFLWIFYQANVSWKTAVDAIEGWGGPEDCDIGSYEDRIPLEEAELIQLRRRYIRTAIATAYSIIKESESALKGIYRINLRVNILMNKESTSSLEACYTKLTPVKNISRNFLDKLNTKHLKTLMDDNNPITSPTDASAELLYASLISSTLCYLLGCSINVKYAAMLVLERDKDLQSLLFNKLLLSIKNKSRESEEFFVRVRDQLLWLRSWGVEESFDSENNINGIGIFGQLSKEFIEIEFLKVLLSNAHYSLAQSIYETPKYRSIPRKNLREVILATAIEQYDNATNANISRGRLKNCNDILMAFPKTLHNSSEFAKIENLLQLTSKIEPFRLVLKKGEPFRPVNLRLHENPIMILGKILEQNPRSYKKITGFMEMAKHMAQAGLINGDSKLLLEDQKESLHLLKAFESRVIAMCIDTALVEDDFETAYTYVTVQLKELVSTLQTRMSSDTKGIVGDTTFTERKVDDWIWRASLQVGRYHRNIETADATESLNVADRSKKISHLEKCIDCVSMSLELAPKETLQEILNVYCQCEEKINSLSVQEDEEQTLVDNDTEKLPGGFISTPLKQETRTNAIQIEEEEPISLFDLSRAGMLRAQSGLSALSILKGISKDQKHPEGINESDESGDYVSTDYGRVRKRDQLKNVAVGGLASGVGWLIGAPPPRDNQIND